MSSPVLVPATQPRKAWRNTDDRWLGGVASGLALHLGVQVLYVRIAFVLLAAVGGFGIALYAGLWLVMPTDTRLGWTSPGLEAATRQGKRTSRRPRVTKDLGPLVAVGAVALGAVVLVRIVFGGSMLFWPLLVGALGLATLWRQADEAQRSRWIDSTGRVSFGRAVVGNGGVASYARLVAGLGLLLTALVLFALETGAGVARDVVLSGGLGVAGLALTVGPWLFRLTGDLSEERAARVRSQERADVAAHLHDSVLQTLALIQRHADDGRMVATLARAQERDLRSWLYAEQQPAETSLAGALRAAAAEVEDLHGVPVEVVVVGDLRLSARLEPLALAAREAMANAARHSGADRVDVYAECVDGTAEVFVRDRGRGFVVETVPADRHGVRDSISDRMSRHGGRAEVRTAPGEGTEVRLRMTGADGSDAADGATEEPR